MNISSDVVVTMTLSDKSFVDLFEYVPTTLNLYSLEIINVSGGLRIEMDSNVTFFEVCGMVGVISSFEQDVKTKRIEMNLNNLVIVYNLYITKILEYFRIYQIIL